MPMSDIVACVWCAACVLCDGVLCGGELDEASSHKVSKQNFGDQPPPPTLELLRSSFATATHPYAFTTALYS